MKHIKMFNEEINIPFFNKKKSVHEDDNLAEAMFPIIRAKITGEEIKYNTIFLEYEYDGDKISVYNSGNTLMVNGQFLDCSEEIIKKYSDLFKSKYKESLDDNRNSAKKEVTDKLKNKYRPAPNFYSHGQ